jgi:serine protease Do
MKYTIVLLALTAGLAYTQPNYAPEPEPAQVTKRVIHNGGSFLGVGIQEVDADRAKALKLKEEAGVEVTRVEPDSPAAKAGLKTGDVILQFNGEHVEGIEQFSRLVRETPPGRDVRLLISREGATQTLTAKIGSRKTQAMVMPIMPRIEMPPMPDFPHPAMMWRNSILGVEGEALKGQLADYFGVKEGVLVRSVIKDTPAAKAGIKAGDVILKVNDTKVTSPGDLSSALRALKGKNSATIVVMRDHKEMTLTASIDADRSDWDGVVPARITRGRSVKM